MKWVISKAFTHVLKKWPISFLILFFLTACSNEQQQVDIDKQKIQPERKAIIIEVKLDDKERKDIKNNARLVMLDISQAREHIRNKRRVDALSDIVKARQLIENIQHIIPTYNIRTQIEFLKKKLQYDTAGEVLADMIPIYSMLEDYNFSDKTVTSSLKKAESFLREGKTQEAEDLFNTVIDSLIFMDVEVPLSWTLENLDLAEKSLSGNDPVTDADDYLKASAEGVQILSIGVYTPLSRSKGHYWRASKLYAETRHEEAKKELLKAFDSLSNVKTDPKNKSAIADLRQNLSELNTKVDLALKNTEK